jgi:hypothetical protein
LPPKRQALPVYSSSKISGSSFIVVVIVIEVWKLLFPLGVSLVDNVAAFSGPT